MHTLSPTRRRGRRLPLVATVTAIVMFGLAGCGSDDADAEPDAAESAPDAAEPESDSAESVAAEVTDDQTTSPPTDTGGSGVAITGNGTVEFEISGGYETSGTWEFMPVASYWYDSFWGLTYTDSASPGAILALSLEPSNPSFSFSDGDATIAGAGDQCTWDIAEQSSTTASGHFECSGMTALTSSAANEDVSASGTFTAKV